MQRLPLRCTSWTSFLPFRNVCLQLKGLRPMPPTPDPRPRAQTPDPNPNTITNTCTHTHKHKHAHLSAPLLHCSARSVLDFECLERSDARSLDARRLDLDGLERSNAPALQRLGLDATQLSTRSSSVQPLSCRPQLSTRSCRLGAPQFSHSVVDSARFRRQLHKLGKIGRLAEARWPILPSLCNCRQN